MVQRLKPSTKPKTSASGLGKPCVAPVRLSVPAYLEPKIRKISEVAGISESVIVAEAIGSGLVMLNSR